MYNSNVKNREKTLYMKCVIKLVQYLTKDNNV